ncbi:MAG TPA: hypothetical protein VFE33_05030 [Thermoanaerobaculia bacterium]|nr:hypothetical protein [Thermoanaerobaculia bacterium]
MLSRALAQLESLREPLTADLPIADLEKFEVDWKQALGRAMVAPLTGADARRLAALHRDIGLLPKYKSYAIKASSPLGYSIFLQEPGKGFSFQQHRHHKVEIFHVLEALPGAFALLCTLDEWTAGYDAAAFSHWLDGSSDHPLYEQWRIPLSAGDVICLETTGIVHTVIGCILEEFATASTDMVDRLHDQNAGDPIPGSYQRESVLHRLRTLPSPPTSQRIVTPGRLRQALPRTGFTGGEIVTLGEVPGLDASRLRLESGRLSPPRESGDQALALFTSRADARLLLGTAEEMRHGDPPALELPRGTATMIPPGMRYTLAALGAEVEVSLHAIRPDVALAEL